MKSAGGGAHKRNSRIGCQCVVLCVRGASFCSVNDSVYKVNGFRKTIRQVSL